MAELILETKRLRGLAVALTSLIALMTAGVYWILIAPVFEKPTIAENSVIRDLVGSKEYQSGYRQTFYAINNYNRWPQGTPKPDPESYIAVSSSGFVKATAIVRAFEDLSSPAAGVSSAGGFKFETEYGVSASVPGMVLFLVIEFSLLAAMAYLRWASASKQQLAYEDRIVAEYFGGSERASGSASVSGEHCIFVVEKILLGFHRYCLQLERRKRGKPGVVVADEYDVQDLLLPILRMTFLDVRAEESVPSEAGSNSRIDFLINDHGIAIEVKYVRRSGEDARIADEMLADKVRYRAHPNCKHIIFFIYDPGLFLDNVSALVVSVSDAESRPPINVVVSPARN